MSKGNLVITLAARFCNFCSLSLDWHLFRTVVVEGSTSIVRSFSADVRVYHLHSTFKTSFQDFMFNYLFQRPKRLIVVHYSCMMRLYEIITSIEKFFS